jgi:tetratricopeptide (TPR) repeat protein
MMKYTYVTNLAIATVLVIPAVAIQDDAGGSGLGGTLQGTIDALDELVRIQEGFAQGNAAALDRILGATEAPILDPRGRDEFLVKLREEVNGLQTQVDQAGNNSATSMPHLPTGAQVPLAGMGPALPPGGPGAFGSAQRTQATQIARPQIPPHNVTSGLTSEMREALQSQQLPINPLSPTILNDPSKQRAFEKAGFSADIMRQGRLYFRAGRYAEALTLLEKDAEKPEAMYWIARCFEKLGREDEALEKYRAVMNSGEVTFARRAKHDVDFLEWKRNFFKEDTK